MSESQVLKLIQVLLPYETYKKIKHHAAAKEQLKDLIGLTIKPHLLQTYYTKINGIKQGNFAKIQDYYRVIEKQARIIAIARSENEDQKFHTMESSFFMNLEPFTAIHLQSYKLTNIHDAMEKLVDLENSILARAEIEGSKQNYYETKNNRSINPKQKEYANRHKIKPKNQYKSKWCNFHKTKSHNDEECNAQNRQQKENRHQLKPER